MGAKAKTFLRLSICPVLPLHNPADGVMWLRLPVSSSSSTSIRDRAVLHDYLEKRRNRLSVLGMATRNNLKNKSRWVSCDRPLEDISNVYHAAQQESNLPLSRMPLRVSEALNTYICLAPLCCMKYRKLGSHYFYNTLSGSYAKAGQKMMAHSSSNALQWCFFALKVLPEDLAHLNLRPTAFSLIRSPKLRSLQQMPFKV